MTGNIPSSSLQERIIEDASHAVGQYITRGPTMPPEQHRIVGLESVRGRLARSPYAEHHLVAGWVAIEQAFVIARDPQRFSQHSVEPVLETAEESFTLALDYYDKTIDPPDHLLSTELAMSSISPYKAWITNQPISAQLLTDYHEEVKEIGRGLLDLNAQHNESESSDLEAQKEINGFAAEVGTLLSFNRRQLNGGRVTTLAVPSTLRQDRARQKGTVGSKYDRSQLRSNWDLSVIDWHRGWELRDKLQVKNALSVEDKPRYGKQLQEYTDDITVVGFKEHVRGGLTELDLWKALRVLIGDPQATLSTAQQKRKAVTMSQTLYARIEEDRERRSN